MNNQVLISLAAPVDGKFMKLSQVKDPVFSEGLMGKDLLSSLLMVKSYLQLMEQ
ncbi:hypothetical protein COSHB9_15670 [Companilactobacillus alimentarius]